MSLMEKIKTERKAHDNRKVTTNMLLNRLKNLKQLQLQTPLMKSDEKAGKCW
jgi:hypothetical protein